MKAVIHLDLDAFYAQVEQVRLSLPKSTPLVCIQWAGILAVSYAAREFGISRKDSIQEAKVSDSWGTAWYYLRVLPTKYYLNKYQLNTKCYQNYYLQLQILLLTLSGEMPWIGSRSRSSH